VKKYLVDLTDDFIRRYKFDEIALRMKEANGSAIREIIQMRLETGGLHYKSVTSATIGRILGSIGHMEVQMPRAELMHSRVLWESSDVSDAFRGLAVNCLTSIIFHRLRPTPETRQYIPPYKYPLGSGAI
jgi:hypothetical protein